MWCLFAHQEGSIYRVFGGAKLVGLDSGFNLSFLCLVQKHVPNLQGLDSLGQLGQFNLHSQSPWEQQLLDKISYAAYFVNILNY